MLGCGFPNVITGEGAADSLSDIAIRENCMFKKEFRYSDGYRGICSTQAGKTITQCTEN